MSDENQAKLLDESSAPEPDKHTGEDTGDTSEGELSDVQRMDPADADTPISDSQSVAGSPSDESGEVDEGPTGPNSRAGGNRN